MVSVAVNALRTPGVAVATEAALVVVLAVVVVVLVAVVAVVVNLGTVAPTTLQRVQVMASTPQTNPSSTGQR